MKPKIFLQNNLYIIGLLLSLQTVLTYDLRDSLACSSFSKDQLNITTYSPNPTELSYYRFLLVDSDPDSNTKRLFVGSMNRTTILDLKDISKELQVIPLEPDRDKKQYCIYQKPELPYCQNHIRFITKTKVDKPEYFVCGTNALSPVGYNLTWNGSSFISQSLGSAPCSDDPFSNLTAIYVKNGNPGNKEAMYFGSTAFERSTVYSLIKKDDGTYGEHMKGVVSSKWLKDPQFVESFDVDDKKVFFFFREIAVETEFIERKLYSRVGKFCKKDVGGDSFLRNQWTSYQKARLICSLPGTFPTYFDVIQDVVAVDNNTFYGLFTTNGNGLPGSAICAFDKSDIDRVFDTGPFKAQPNDMSYWVEATNVPTPRPGMCNNDSLKIEDTVLGFIVDHPLMHDPVQQKYGKPLFYLPGEELQQLEMETVDRNSKAFVFYAGSNRGKLYKIFSQDVVNSEGVREYKTFVSSVYSPFEHTEVIWSLKQHGQYVYLGTDKSVIQIDVQNDCKNHRWVDSCVYDPHCAWDIGNDCCLQRHSISKNYWDFNNYTPPGNDVQDQFHAPYQINQNQTNSELRSVKLPLNNKHICTLGRKIVWKKTSNRPKRATDEMIIKLGDVIFVDNEKSLVISNLTVNDGGIYVAYDSENPNLIAANYTVSVITQDNLSEIYKAKFAEWCDYFAKGKAIQDQYTRTCNKNN